MARVLARAVLWGGCALLALLNLAQASDPVIVANPSVRASSIAVGDLRDIFLGEKLTLPDGSRVEPVLLKGGPVHEAFLKAYIAKTDWAFRASWRKLVFTGRGVLPKTFDTPEALLNYVAKTPGAIGYANVASHANVKTLVVK